MRDKGGNVRNRQLIPSKRYLERDVATREFLTKAWRKRPLLFKKLIKQSVLSKCNRARFVSWCASPSSARIYLRSEDNRSGSAQAWVVPQPEDAPRIFDELSDEGYAPTLLLNRVEYVDPEIVALRADFGIGLEWRHDDVVATLSLPQSGIGYHAGHEDGFIVQLVGSRNWRVWPPSCLPVRYRRSLLDDPWARRSRTPPRPEVPPVLDCRLEAGDVLYIPALHGHEGITKHLSISLSVAWRGLSCYRMLERLLGKFDKQAMSAIRRQPKLFFRLLNDPPTDESDLAVWFCRELHECISYLTPYISNEKTRVWNDPNAIVGMLSK
jgi:50S ribosomal protein L16 3-hydroxylase